MSGIKPLTDEVLARLRALTANDPKYLKMMDGGFADANGQTTPEVIGVIEAVTFFYQCYERGIYNRIPFEEVKGDPPQNYELRADIQIKTINGPRYDLTLPKSSVRKHLLPYVYNLSSVGMQPIGGVVTKLGVKKVEWQTYKFNVVTFEMVGPAEKVETELPQEDKNQVA